MLHNLVSLDTPRQPGLPATPLTQVRTREEFPVSQVRLQVPQLDHSLQNGQFCTRKRLLDFS